MKIDEKIKDTMHCMELHIVEFNDRGENGIMFRQRCDKTECPRYSYCVYNMKEELLRLKRIARERRKK